MLVSANIGVAFFTRMIMVVYTLDMEWNTLGILRVKTKEFSYTLSINSHYVTIAHYM